MSTQFSQNMPSSKYYKGDVKIQPIPTPTTTPPPLCRRRLLLHQFPKHILPNLPRARLGQLRQDLDRLGDHELLPVLLRPRNDIRRVGRRGRVPRRDVGLGALAPVVVRDGDDGGLKDRRMFCQERLQGYGRDVLTAWIVLVVSGTMRTDGSRQMHGENKGIG